MQKFDWKKRGMIFQSTGRSDWMQHYAQVPTVLEKESILRIYFTCRPKPDEYGRFVSHTGFVDVDKKDLSIIKNISSEPIINLGKKGAFDEFGIHPTGVIEKDGKVYLYYTGWSRPQSVPYETWIGLLISHDGGETFERYSDGPIVGKSSENPYLTNGAIVFPWKDGYEMIYAAAGRWMSTEGGKYEPVYTLKRAFSDNGIDWQLEKGPMMESLSPDECVSRPAIFVTNEGCYLWYGYRRATDFHGGNNSYKIGMAYSTDGQHWERKDNESGIPLSAEGWDSEMMSYPYVHEQENRLILLYNGNAFGKEGFGYATSPK